MREATAAQKLGATGPRRMGSANGDPEIASIPDYVLNRLLTLPEKINERQAAFDEVEQNYQRELYSLTVDALEARIFKTKDGEPRAASNDTERKSAVDYQLSSNESFIQLATEYLDAKRLLELAKRQFEAAKIAAQLLATL